MTKRPPADDLPIVGLPEEKFAFVSVDFPWHFESRAPSENPESVRSPQRHYPTMSLPYIEQFPMKSLLLPDAHVALWLTTPLMVQGIHVRLAKAFGLQISTMAWWWLKTLRSFDMGQLKSTPLFESDLHMGNGFTTRHNVEMVILMRRGSPSRLRADVREVMLEPEQPRLVYGDRDDIIISNLQQHSRKPDEFYRRAEAYAVGPRIDLFGGVKRPGWTWWGNEHWEPASR